MSEATITTDPSEIELSRHAVIEASAGTGKTYTITKLLVRLLLERSIPIERILMVTFTEKATSELKERIRGEIAAELERRSDAEDKKALADALANFSNARIFTIHGFCNKVLKENAFETSQVFDLEVVDDSDIIQEEFNAIKREWINIPNIKSILNVIGYNAKWEERIASLATAIDWETDRVVPSPLPWDELTAATEPISGKVFEVSVMRELNSRLGERKVANGMISYDDMVGNLRDALNPSKTPSAGLLTSRLRSNYDIALVDEFQDTNMRQWSVFKRIFFEDAAETGNRLMIIGDPKQAIYGFRGADVHAYEKAKRELLDAGAGFYRLAVNYRSMPDLTQAFNIFFEEWYGEEAHVDSPADRTTSGPQLGFDHTGSKAFNFVEATHEEMPANLLKRDIARTYAEKVGELLGDMEIHLGTEKRLLEPSDICFLVRNKSEAPFVEEALRRRGIPSTFYKKPGLYASDEAIQFQIILAALAEPEGKGLRKAAMSIFFSWKSDKPQCLEEPPPPSVETRWLRVVDYAARREWPTLFKELLERSGACFELADEPRRATNLRQIARELTYEAMKRDLDAAGLLGRLNERIKGSQSTDEALHERETDNPAVKIMTIHSSKGLEFPVVFLFAGMTGNNHKDKYAKYYDRENEETVYDFSENAVKSLGEVLEEEKLNEVRRLYYVAFTRAVFKIFVPVYVPKSKRGGYTTYVLNRVLNSREAIDEIQPVAGETLPDAAPNGDDLLESKVPLTPPTPPNAAFRTRRVLSFSTLARTDALDSADFIIGDSSTAAKTSDEPAVPLESYDGERIAVQPPPGPRSGDVLHDTLERLDFGIRAASATFDEFRSHPAVSELIAGRMEEHGFKTDEIRDERGKVIGSLTSEFAKLIWNALGKRLRFLNGERLCDIPASDLRKEMGFLLSIQGDALTGIIDLLFRIPDANGGWTYYILDWKSNYSPEGYATDTLRETVMREHKYNLQYELYALAVRRWFDSLKLDGARLGGAVYMFCRGVDCATDDDMGIVFDDLARFDADKLESELARKTV